MINTWCWRHRGKCEFLCYIPRGSICGGVATSWEPQCPLLVPVESSTMNRAPVRHLARSRRQWFVNEGRLSFLRLGWTAALWKANVAFLVGVSHSDTVQCSLYIHKNSTAYHAMRHLGGHLISLQSDKNVWCLKFISTTTHQVVCETRTCDGGSISLHTEL